MIYKEISIGFAPDLVSLILGGSKTLTYRLGDKYDFLQVGDQIEVKNSSNQKVFAQVEITEKSFTQFKDLPLDRKGHEVYSSKQDRADTFKKYYKRDFQDNDKILGLGFKVTKKY